MRIERGYFFKSQLCIERCVPRHIAKRREGQRAETRIASIDLARAEQPRANSAILKFGVHIHFPDVKLSSEGLAGQKSCHLVAKVRDILESYA